MKTTLVPLELKKNHISYLTQTFFFTECLRKKHTGHRFFLLCEKNKVFSNPHGSTILKTKNIMVYISKVKRKEQAGMILCAVRGCSFHRNNATVLGNPSSRGMIFFSQSRADGFELIKPHTSALRHDC